jgi:hypothetical protein
MSAVHWNHERSSDILVSPAWSDATNEFGFPGTSARGGSQAASHGSDNPYELQTWLIAAGPDFKSKLRSNVPTGNVDLAPTLLHLSGIDPPETMTGRVLSELLIDGPIPTEVETSEVNHRAAVTLPDGMRYEAELLTLIVGSTAYPRAARTTRSSNSPE